MSIIPLSPKPKGKRWNYYCRYFEIDEEVQYNPDAHKFAPVKATIIGFHVNRFGRISYTVQVPEIVEPIPYVILEDLIPLYHVTYGKRLVEKYQ